MHLCSCFSSLPPRVFCTLTVLFLRRCAFPVLTQDGARLYVDGVLVLSSWTNSALTEVSGTIALAENMMYEITLEYREGTGNAQVELRWSSSLLVRS